VESGKEGEGVGQAGVAGTAGRCANLPGVSGPACQHHAARTYAPQTARTDSLRLRSEGATQS